MPPLAIASHLPTTLFVFNRRTVFLVAQDADAALDCARKAMEQNLPPMVPQELTHDAHLERVREIFEPMMMSLG